MDLTLLLISDLHSMHFGYCGLRNVQIVRLGWSRVQRQSHLIFLSFGLRLLQLWTFRQSDLTQAAAQLDLLDAARPEDLSLVFKHVVFAQARGLRVARCLTLLHFFDPDDFAVRLQALVDDVAVDLRLLRDDGHVARAIRLAGRFLRSQTLQEW